ncbi:YciI family protein [Pseudotenacibaculum haliotis]|uniref:YciI family protein n=1 Tax=Pseudotenacibaculum haliotis TaxID=1862138 RepID=A0ABW5LS14_9FLAO
MKKLVLLLVLLVYGSISAQKTNPNYDADLAKKVGADDYGMKSYIFVILKTGTNTSQDKDLKNKAFSGHMDNINRLVKNKKMIVAGPMQKNDKTYRGIFILDVPTIEEAKKLLQTDPAIKEKYLAPELYVWYGSAALATYLESADKVWKKGF